MHLGPFIVGVSIKKKKDSRVFLEVLSKSNIYMNQILVRKIE
jgi:hypothetical protein